MWSMASESSDEAALSFPQRLASASTGALLTALCVTPLDVIKTRMQLTAPARVARGVDELAACPRCGVFVLNNGLMEHTLSKGECASAARAQQRICMYLYKRDGLGLSPDLSPL